MVVDSFIHGLGGELGAEDGVTGQKFTIYLPDRDRYQNPVRDIEKWINAGMIMMAEINTGVTRLPWADGIWHEKDLPPIKEKTTVIYSYVMDPVSFEQNLLRVRDFLHAFGKKTEQKTVIAQFSGEIPGEGGDYFSRTYQISTYD